MNDQPVRAVVAPPLLLKPGPTTPLAVAVRAQALLAAPAPGQITVLSDPLQATVQNPSGEPAQARGIERAEQIGPLIDANGLNRIILHFPVTTSDPFAFGNATATFGVLPILDGPASGTSFTLGAGSVWFATNMLVPAIGAGNFSGFLISGGTLTASATITLTAGTYIVPAGATLTLTATLAPPATPATPAGAGTLGKDFTAATVSLPKTVTIVFKQGSATVQALGSSSLDVYGSTVNLTFNGAAAEAVAGFPAILVPCTVSSPSFAFTSVASTVFEPSGTAAVTSGGWSLPITETTLASLGNADAAGSLVLELGAGASLACAPRQGEATIGGWLIGLNTAQLIVIAGGTGPASVSAYTLWKPQPPATVRSTVDWTNLAGFIGSVTATPGHELLALTGGAAAFLDRPLAVDGGALPIASGGTLFLNVTPTGTAVSILAETTTTPTKTFSLALENALIGALAPQLFYVSGAVASPEARQLLDAAVVVQLEVLWLLPTLPDPYAASFDPAAVLNRGRIGLLSAGLGWEGDPSTTVAFGVSIGPLPDTDTVPILPSGLLTLLDLSTRVDLFGVRVVASRDDVAGVQASSAPGFVGLSLAVPDATVETFALPQLSWEPMLDRSTVPPSTLAALPATDGVATSLHAASLDEVETQTLVAVAPEPVLLRTIGNVAAGAAFEAEFSLPFGLVASITQPNGPGTAVTPTLFGGAGGVFALIQPNFAAAGSGAYQLTLKPPNPTQSNTTFGGSTTISADGAAPGYGTAVLGTDVAAIFTPQFSGGGGVPLLRADLAGYGASIWSEWQIPNPAGTEIIKVQFETVVGRTAYEVVKAQTTLYPHGVRLVRTVTIARQNAGWMQRSDSGWVAATPGIYNFPSAQFGQNLVNRGAVAGVFNVRNLREFETVVAGTFTYRRVLFDADVGLDHRVVVRAGGKPSTLTDAAGQPVTLVPARDLTGYVQIAPNESAVPPPANPNPAPADLAKLFSAVGPITDSFSCTAEIGGTPTATGTLLRCSGISFNMTPSIGGEPPQLGAALLSSPVLPKDGAWGFGKRAAAATAPTPLPKGVPVPLVQQNTDPSTWHFADIADVLSLTNPANVYGLLQDTGTQRTLFEQPTVPDLTGAAAGAVPSIKLPAGVAPALADLGSILGATGLFPDIAKTISFFTNVIEQLQTIPQGLAYSKNIPVNQGPTTLIDLGILSVALIYGDASQTTATQISFNIDPAHTLPASDGRDWWLTIGPISFAVTVPQFQSSGPILTITGNFAADDRSTPGLTGLKIDYGSALSDIQSLFNKLQALSSLLPGGAGAGLDVSLSDGQLTVRDTFALPTLPLGLGTLSDISLDLGLTLTLSPFSADFIVGIGDPGNPFDWIVSPLSGNGAIDLGVKGGQPDFLIQAGIGLGLAIDIGIAEGSASITLAVSLEINGDALTIMIILNGQASVDVLGGLASASLSLTAAVGVTIDPPVPVPQLVGGQLILPSETVTFLASVAVGIHISICWVLSVSFEGSWSFSQSVSTPQLAISA